jgi:regulatory protein
LQRITGHYLERYSSSVDNLRRLLQRRVHRAAAHHGDDPAEGERLVEEELARLVQLGFLNDDAYARGRARSLLRRGNGPRLVRTKLRQKGVDASIIDAVLAEVEAELQVDPQRLSAALYARKRRMGPWARPPRGADSPEARRERRQRDLQRMARAGFGYDLARDIVDVTPGSPEAEELEELILVRRTL